MEKVLEVVESKIVVESEKELNPIDFFQDRQGLYVWNSFKNNIVTKAEKLPAPYKSSVAYFKLTKSATDEQIESSLSEKHIFSETEVCAIIAALIEKQSKGEGGVLLNDGNWNLFYTQAFVVSVGWHEFYGSWGVDTWKRDGDGWDADVRVFSPATEL